MTKLAIVQEREEDKYDHRTTLKCWQCDPVNGKEIVADDNTVCIFLPRLAGPCVHASLLGIRQGA